MAKEYKDVRLVLFMAGDEVLLDVGSSSVKVYIANGGRATLKGVKSISFKQDFSDEGISLQNEADLIEFFKDVKGEYPGLNVGTYATAVFRKLNEGARQRLVDNIYTKTGLTFNIISQEMESFYLEKALVGRCNLDEPLLLINIGGGSVELVVVCGGNVVERKNVDIGVGTLLEKFPGVNDEISSLDKKVLIDFVISRLPELESDVGKAFYTGGELNYMQLVGYPLVKNDFFDDVGHPSVIRRGDFSAKNDEVFSKIGLVELESLMPDAPKWMYGARACSALAEAICEKYDIEYIIPSDSNLIDGVCVHEFRE